MKDKKPHHFHPERKKVVLFDMNGTIIDRNQTFKKCFLYVMRDFIGRQYSDSEENPLNAESILGRYEKAYENLERKKKRTSGELQRKSLRQALEAYPFELTDAFIHKLLGRIRSLRSELPVPSPGIVKAINELSRHYKLAVISNNPKSEQLAAIDSLKLSSIFPEDRIFTPEKTNAKKPSVKMYRYALDALKARPSEAVMIGDSWRNDIHGATRAGIDAVWLKPEASRKLPRQKADHDAVITVASSSQLLRLFSKQA